MIELPAFLNGTATCAQPEHDPDLWASALPADQHEAARICQGCPLRPACADYALTRPEERGTWGGLTVTERRRILRPDDETWLDDQGRVRVPCGSYKALFAHIRYGEECQPCRDAQAARTRAARVAQLAQEHEVGGTVAGAAIHRRLGEPVCVGCRAAVARQSAVQRAARQAGEQRPTLALAS
ncbi:WhiB family transcriptional regulator [Streptomyces sp. NBC_01108]|uniref:WhiB family transcriptional regulator n=1 Tax=Streptomyces sp. NBC_01108 TaxID=2903751 RepID=UPI003873A999|nr:WhiB family transcriptional regulator [Streptomyces sp. NBC_01108]